MTVIFGSSSLISGTGQWSYPDAGIVIGIKIAVTTAPTSVNSWGSTIERFTKLGVYAPVDEAGRMHAQPVWNDEEVSYDIGKSPVGFAYDLVPGAELTVTEILSETPPTGGGGTDVQAGVVYDWDTNQNIPTSTWTTMASGGLKAQTNSAVLAATPDGGVTVHQNGVYIVSAFAVAPGASTSLTAKLQYTVNGSGYDTQEVSYDPAGIGPMVNLTYMHNHNAGDVLTFELWHNAGSTIGWAAVLSYGLLAPS